MIGGGGEVGDWDTPSLRKGRLTLRPGKFSAGSLKWVPTIKYTYRTTSSLPDYLLGFAILKADSSMKSLLLSIFLNKTQRFQIFSNAKPKDFGVFAPRRFGFRRPSSTCHFLGLRVTYPPPTLPRRANCGATSWHDGPIGFT